MTDWKKAAAALDPPIPEPDVEKLLPVMDALEAAFRSFPESVKAAVLHGEGEHFSAGLDLGELVETDLNGAIAHSRMWHRAFEAIEFGRALFHTGTKLNAFDRADFSKTFAAEDYARRSGSIAIGH